MPYVSLFSVIALGFFLGMRHATDPDHVIAVTTIVARHRSVKHAAVIGALWGVGHTVTILVVGGGIILFGWVIPARVGLSMEFSVGLMLILLGILNLTGIMQWINANSRLAARAAPLRRNSLHSHAHSHGEYIHTHPHAHSPEAHTHEPVQTPLNWFDRHFGGIGLYNGSPARGRPRSWPRWVRRRRSARPDHDPPSVVGRRLPCRFGVGTIAGMMLITARDGRAVRLRRKSFSRMNWALASLPA